MSEFKENRRIQGVSTSVRCRVSLDARFVSESKGGGAALCWRDQVGASALLCLLRYTDWTFKCDFLNMHLNVTLHLIKHLRYM